MPRFDDMRGVGSRQVRGSGLESGLRSGTGQLRGAGNDEARRAGVATAGGARLRRGRRGEAVEGRRGWSRGPRLGGGRLRREVRAARATERRTGAGRAAPSGRTLEDVLASAWEDLMAGARTGCPVCGGAMTSGGGAPRDGSGIGSCGDCGSELA